LQWFVGGRCEGSGARADPATRGGAAPRIPGMSPLCTCVLEGLALSAYGIVDPGADFRVTIRRSGSVTEGLDEAELLVHPCMSFAARPKPAAHDLRTHFGPSAPIVPSPRSGSPFSSCWHAPAWRTHRLCALPLRRSLRGPDLPQLQFRSVAPAIP
jgi:hypothetical protein